MAEITKSLVQGAGLQLHSFWCWIAKVLIKPLKKRKSGNRFDWNRASFNTHWMWYNNGTPLVTKQTKWTKTSRCMSLFSTAGPAEKFSVLNKIAALRGNLYLISNNTKMGDIPLDTTAQKALNFRWLSLLAAYFAEKVDQQCYTSKALSLTKYISSSSHFLNIKESLHHFVCINVYYVEEVQGCSKYIILNLNQLIMIHIMNTMTFLMLTDHWVRLQRSSLFCIKHPFVVYSVDTVFSDILLELKTDNCTITQISAGEIIPHVHICWCASLAENLASNKLKLAWTAAQRAKHTRKYIS